MAAFVAVMPCFGKMCRDNGDALRGRVLARDDHGAACLEDLSIPVRPPPVDDNRRVPILHRVRDNGVASFCELF